MSGGREKDIISASAEPGMNPVRKMQGTRSILGTAFAIGLFVFWQLLAVIIGKPFLLPGPLDVLESILKNREALFLKHFPSTMKAVLLGCFFSVLIGAAFAVLMDLDRRIEKALFPILTATQTIPVMCLAPVFVLWFGYSLRMRVIVVVLVNFFTITVNLHDGFRSAGTAEAELLSTFGANRRQQFLFLRLPAALPSFFTALRLTVPWSVVGGAVAEWLGAPDGLGTFSRERMSQLDAAGLLAPLVILTITALLFDRLISLCERRMIFWRAERKEL